IENNLRSITTRRNVIYIQIYEPAFSLRRDCERSICLSAAPTLRGVVTFRVVSITRVCSVLPRLLLGARLAHRLADARDRCLERVEQLPERGTFDEHAI